MPRLQLTEEEARFIEDLRRKNTAAIAYNEGIEETLGQLKIFLESGHATENWKEDFEAHARSFKRKLVGS
jgi:hypothetical protein